MSVKDKIFCFTCYLITSTYNKGTLIAYINLQYMYLNDALNSLKIFTF